MKTKPSLKLHKPSAIDNQNDKNLSADFNACGFPVLIDANALALIVNLCPQNIRKLAAQGKIPYRRIGGAVRFCLADVMEASKVI